MTDSSKTRQASIDELASLRQRIRELEQSEAERKKIEEALWESEERYRNAFENHTAVKLLIDPDTGSIIDANEAAVDYYGWSHDRLRQMTIQEINTLSPEDVKKEMEKAVTRKRTHFDFRHRRADGSIRDVEVFSSKIKLKGKDILHSIIHDITERKQAEEALHQSREAAERSANELAILADIGRLIGSTLEIDKVYERVTTEIRKLIPFDSLIVNLSYVQQKTQEVTYVAGLDIPGRRMGDSYPLQGSVTEEAIRIRRGVMVQSENPQDLIDMFPSLAVSVGAGMHSIMSIPLFSRDETIGSLLIRSKKPGAYTEQDLLLAEKIGMQISGAIANAQMFNELKKTEKLLRGNNELFSLYMHHSPIYTYIKEVTPTRSLVLQASDNFRQMIGIPGEEMVGKTMAELFPPEFAAKMTADDWATVSRGDVRGLDEEFNGRCYTTIKFPIVREEKTLLAGYTIDITERKQAEASLRESGNLYRKMNENSPLGMHFYKINDKNQLFFVGANPAADKLLGVDNSQFIGKTIEEAFPSLIQTEVPERYRDAAEKGIPWSTEQIVYDDKKIKGAFEVRAFQTTPENMVAIFADITERKRAEEMLQKSEMLYHGLVETSQDLIWQCDAEGRYTYLNPAWEQVFGYKVEEMIGKKYSDFQTPEMAMRDQKEFDRLMQGNSVKGLETVHTGKTGDEIHLVFNAKCLTDENGKARGTHGTAYDITERKRAEEEQRRSREIVERLADELAVIAEIGLIIGSTLDIDEVYERFAAEAKKLIAFDRIVVNLNDPQKGIICTTYSCGLDVPGRRPGDIYPLAGSVNEILIKRRAGMINHPSSIEDITKQCPGLAPAFQAGMRSIIAVPLISRGVVIGGLHFHSKMPNAHTEQDLRLAERIGAQIAGAMDNAQLFSDFNRAATSLRESESRFRAIFEQAAVGVAEIEIATGRFLVVNRQLCEIVGRTEKELLATTFYALTHPDDLGMHKAKTELLLAGKIGYYNLEKRYLRKDGGIVWVNLTSSPLWKPGERPTCNLVVVQDITERRQAEAEMKSLQERLQRAEKMEALGTLAGGVAHDLNNVLGIVVGYAELLLNEVDQSSPINPHLQNIMAGGERAAAIVQDLLTLARRGVSNRQILNLNKIVMDCRNLPEFKNLSSCYPAVRIRTDLEPDILNISGSSIHLSKTLFNLVSNAAEAMPKGGVLAIKTANQYLDKPIKGYDEVREGDYVVLSVSDTGEGIPAADLKRIFEPFYTKKVMGRSGTGLGLSVVWGTVKDHYGYINVQSEEGKGSTFTLFFPVTREEIPAESVAASLSEYRGKGESILVVDDVQGQRDLMAEMLRNLNYNVATAASGEEAVAYLKEHKADLMVLDMIMEPGMDGLETYQSVLGAHPKQKAIIVSVHPESPVFQRRLIPISFETADSLGPMWPNSVH